MHTKFYLIRIQEEQKETRENIIEWAASVSKNYYLSYECNATTPHFQGIIELDAYQKRYKKDGTIESITPTKYHTKFKKLAENKGFRTLTPVTNNTNYKKIKKEQPEITDDNLLKGYLIYIVKENLASPSIHNISSSTPEDVMGYTYNELVTEQIKFLQNAAKPKLTFQEKLIEHLLKIYNKDTWPLQAGTRRHPQFTYSQILVSIWEYYDKERQLMPADNTEYRIIKTLLYKHELFRLIPSLRWELNQIDSYTENEMKEYNNVMGYKTYI